MNNEDLVLILAKGENTRIEYKEATENLPLSFFQTVVSFLNCEGGIVVLGADVDGRVTGINSSCIDQLSKGILDEIKQLA